MNLLTKVLCLQYIIVMSDLTFSEKRVRQQMKNVCDDGVTKQASVYMTSVLEYLVRDIFTKVQISTSDSKRIKPKDLQKVLFGTKEYEALKQDSVDFRLATFSNLDIK